LVSVGQVVTYTIVFLADNEPGTVLITDAIPLSTTYHVDSITATGSAGVGISTAIVSNILVWTATNVTINTQVTATFVVTVNQGAGQGVPIVNTAWLTDGTTLYSTSTTITTPNPAITVTKTASADSATIGEVVTYSYRITNTGNVTLNNITLVDDKLGEITPNKTVLGPDEYTTAEKVYTVQADDFPGPLANTAVVTGTAEVGSDQVTAEATVQVNLTTNPAITLTKTASADSATIGEVVTYSYRITNTGNVTLNNITLVDDQLGEITPDETVLGPDEYTTAEKSYTVQSDGMLTNIAVVTGTDEILGNRVTANAGATIMVEKLKVYLPVITKPAPTELTVIAENTNGITYLRIGPKSAPVCEVLESDPTIPDCDPNNCDNPANKPCPDFPPGNYDVEARTNNCGTLTASNRYFESGPHTMRVFCN
jgi:uncharacterized repeat protein (TIGR01451 family)